ncbi:hypothetical protein DM01DRAFT_1333465 [Hesseltinella vesiculosa]|uniref:Copper-fist domain-containing protein n=1 Tax=Hesseltinella vesiculosa TaxID=101127 RepID=A0A1X2GQ24_9FUNG|nr:hypothetical protein DM01DRAFT_1333465 [Hesseltinella vesiculosa]
MEESIVPETKEMCTCTDANHDHSKASNSYSWAVITQPQENSLFPDPVSDDPVNLGLIFHKSNTQRFLEGQPRPPRKKSTSRKRPASPHHLATVQQPSSTGSGSTSLSSTPSSSSYLAINDKANDETLMSLLDLPSSTPLTVNNEQEADLAAILNNVLRPTDTKMEVDIDFVPAPNPMYEASVIDNLASAVDPPAVTPTGFAQDAMMMPIYPTSSPVQPPQHAQHGCSGNSLDNSMCPNGQLNMAESVIITIAPLSATTNHPMQEQMRTRIVTCYCGASCTCPGCLVHPGDFRVGDQYMDPFSGFPTSSACPSSTASSIYSASDDEDVHVLAPPPSLF